MQSRSIQVSKEPVVDSFSGKYTAVSLVNYTTTTGLCTRVSCKPVLIGYCIENPLEVLRTAYANYHVTRINDYDLFGSAL